MQSASSHNSHTPQPCLLTDDQMSLIASALLDMQRALNHQTILIAQLQDELAELRRHNDWYHAQFAQMFRVVARDVRELRATLICSLLEEGPITADRLITLLRQTPDEELEHKIRSGTIGRQTN
ncbi:MAG: hypothetical protein J7463_14125 [Roseiflexus sp.]|nr:hypothetical protein [Roseiflexus sp.]MBO9335824.1 hypothetical protein [Roseiflexus sp.]MBO9365459.1 hypothetical protein [Roseiflexus sp.]MBO9384286.1 hypothetical protein [Roseiflexus sp.]MBO9389167.1 hypothetical protein [Roseiflexus sp.]